MEGLGLLISLLVSSGKLFMFFGGYARYNPNLESWKKGLVPSIVADLLFLKSLRSP